MQIPAAKEETGRAGGGDKEVKPLCSVPPGIARPSKSCSSPEGLDCGQG